MRRKRLLWALAVVATLGLAGLYVSFGPPQLMAKTSKAEFCGTECHVMEPEHAAWQHSVHRGIECVDCHLPHDNVANYYLWKGIDGGRDIFDFNTNRIPDPITLGEHGKRTVKANCLRCHGEMVSRIETGDRECWDCHRQLRHRGGTR